MGVLVSWSLRTQCFGYSTARRHTARDILLKIVVYANACLVARGTEGPLEGGDDAFCLRGLSIEGIPRWR